MNDAQQHRGPDDEGAWTNVTAPPADGVSFSFRRLAIIDLSPEGHQPMVDPVTGNVVIFNGELYNYKELRRELQREGLQFRSQCDTEVLLKKAYARWGTEALHSLRGMFAFALWDERRRYALLARDRLGIKPLYMATIDRPAKRRTVLFASELRTLLTGGLVERRFNPDSVASYVWNGFVVGPETIIKGIQLLAPGAAAIVQTNGTCELHRYWRLPQYKPTHDGLERLTEALETSAQQHLVSDVPLGVFLAAASIPMQLRCSQLKQLERACEPST
ncbi:MAG: asparagine synthetase B family protein [Woeseiaceae bacterium]